MMLEECPNCYGDKKEPGEFTEKTCDQCSGEGWLEEVPCDLCGGEGCGRCEGDGVLYNVDCPQCRSEGILYTPVPCRTCKGWGTVIPEHLVRKFMEKK